MKNATTMDELGHAIIREVSKTTKVVGLAWNLTWDEFVNNSRQCPENYRINWGGKEENADGTPLPRGYPGWYGRIWIRYEVEPNFFDAADCLERQRVYPGTGGGGSYNGIWDEICDAHNRARDPRSEDHPKCYSWDCKIFEWDFLNVNDVEEYKKQMVWSYLSDEKLDKLTHRFEWNDPDTAAKDEAFIAKYEKPLW